MKEFTKVFALSAVVIVMFVAGQGAAQGTGGEANTQVAELFKLQAAFHRAASVHDPANGDSANVIDQRIRDMLSLWASDAVLVLAVGGSRDGNYIGTGDPDDPSTCPTLSSDPNHRGSLCTFFKYVAGSFQPANKFVSLAPAYSTRIDIHGDTSMLYFECHYFNVALDANSGKPVWTAVSHVQANAIVRKVDGRWLFSYVNAPAAGVPIPSRFETQP